MNNVYDMKTLLEIIFKYTKKNAKILADQYLLKDVSIISKWRNNVIHPKNDDIFRIVEFVNNEATFSQKELIRDSIEELIINSPIKSKVKDIIFNTKDFSEFLKEAISVSMPTCNEKNVLYCSEEEKNARSIIKKGRKAKVQESYSGTVEIDFTLPEGNNINLQKIAVGAGVEFKGTLNLTPKKKKLKVANFLKSSTALGVLLVWIVSGTIIAFSMGILKTNPFVYASKNSDAYGEPTSTVMDSNALDTENINEYGTPVVDDSNSSISGKENNDVNSVPIENEQDEKNLSSEAESAVPSPLPTPEHLLESQEIDSSSNDKQRENNQNANNTTNNQTNNINKGSEQNTTNNISKQSEKNTTNNTEVNSWNNFNIQISGGNNSLIVGEQNAVSVETD